jgi:hypothetical protein
MAYRKIVSSLASVLVLAFALGTTAHGQLFRAYVASDGSDSNPCTLPLPCRLLPKALTTILDGGEIWMLDSANYNTGTVIIPKSVTILAIPGAVGSVVSTGTTDAISIAAPNAKVTLRNLVIVALGASNNGVAMTSNGELNIIGCDIANLQASALSVFPSSGAAKVSIRESTLRNNGAGVAAVGNVKLVIDGSLLRDHTGQGLLLGNSTSLSLSNSVVSGNTTGVYAQTFGSGANATTQVNIERSIITQNEKGVDVQSFSAGDTLRLGVSHTAVTHSAVAGITLDERAGTTLTAVIDGNTVTNNLVGFSFTGTLGAELLSRGNNTVRFNGADLSGGAIVAMPGM